MARSPLEIVELLDESFNRCDIGAVLDSYEDGRLWWLNRAGSPQVNSNCAARL